MSKQTRGTTRDANRRRERYRARLRMREAAALEWLQAEIHKEVGECYRRLALHPPQVRVLDSATSLVRFVSIEVRYPASVRWATDLDQERMRFLSVLRARA